MAIIYTRHAEDKLQRADIKKLKIKKAIIKKVLENPLVKTKTKSGEYAAISGFDGSHDLLVVYDIINNNIKVITFYISRRGRYQ